MFASTFYISINCTFRVTVQHRKWATILLSATSSLCVFINWCVKTVLWNHAALLSWLLIWPLWYSSRVLCHWQTDRQTQLTDSANHCTWECFICICVFGVDLCHSRQCTSEDQRRVGSAADTCESDAWQVHLASSHYWVGPAVCWYWQEAGSK